MLTAGAQSSVATKHWRLQLAADRAHTSRRCRSGTQPANSPLPNCRFQAETTSAQRWHQQRSSESAISFLPDQVRTVGQHSPACANLFTPPTDPFQQYLAALGKLCFCFFSVRCCFCRFPHLRISFFIGSTLPRQFAAFRLILLQTPPLESYPFYASCPARLERQGCTSDATRPPSPSSLRQSAEARCQTNYPRSHSPQSRKSAPPNLCSPR